MSLDEMPFDDGRGMLRWITTPGVGSPVLYLHGLGCHAAASWTRTAVTLGRPGILVDLPGHGRSDHPRSFDYSYPAVADVLADLIRHLDVGAMDVVSHSLGGSLAIVLAERHPDLVRTSVLVEPAIDPVPITPGTIAALSEEEMLADGWSDFLAAELDWRRCDMRLADPIAILRYAVHLSDALGGDVHRMLAQPAVPTMLVTGDVRTYLDQGDFAAGGVRDVRVTGAQHFVMWDQPDAFVALLREALPR